MSPELFSKRERFSTRLGVFQADWSGGELSELTLLDEPAEISPADRNSPLAQKIRRHLSGESQDFRDIPLQTERLTDFARQVYEEARHVPSGSTVTYLELAQRLQNPGAVRAVGGALGRNPYLIVVPCHRILAANGKLGGFSAPGGCQTKELLLAAEGYGTQSLFHPELRQEAETLLRKCPKLGPVIDRAKPFPTEPLYPDSPFGALARGVLYQQLAGAAARAIEERVKKLGSTPFPTAEELDALDSEVLRKAGVSRPKIATLKGLAGAVLQGSLEPQGLYLLPNRAVEEKVSKLKGLGAWSARIFLLFHLGRCDIFPVKDLGIRKGMQLLFQDAELPKSQLMERRAKKWRPYRSLASWYLWRSLEV